jgi:hypothetical protein
MRVSDVFAIDRTATPERLAQAAAVRAQCTAVVEEHGDGMVEAWNDRIREVLP